MIEVQIIELLSEKISGEWGDESMSDQDANVIRTANFTNTGEIRFDNIVKRSIDAKIVKRKKLYEGDIIIEKSGGSPNQPVGRVVYFEAPDKETYLCNNFTTVLRPNKELVQPRYLFYLLYYNYQIGKVLSFQNKTTGIINLKLDRYLSSSIFYDPDLDTQNKIVAILDKAHSLVKKREKTISKYDELLRAMFLDMFGDPILNPLNWEIMPFKKVATNENRKRVPIKEADRDKREGIYPYYGATGIIDYIDDFKFDGQYLLIAEDGKNLLFRKKNNAFLASGKFWVNNHAHVFSHNGTCSLNYLLFFLNNISLEPYITGIDQIKLNKDNLDKIPVPVPSKSLQYKFDKLYEKYQTAIKKQEISLFKCIDLSNALSQLAFNGDLTFTTAVELEAFLNKIDPEKEDKENDISAAIANDTLLRLLVTRLNKQEFETFNQYEKGKYVVFRILKENKAVIQQKYNSKDEQIELTI